MPSNPPSSSPYLTSLPGTTFFPHPHWSQNVFQKIERRIQPRFHRRNRATQDLRHLFELESLIDLQKHRLTLVLAQPAQRRLHRERQLHRKHPAAASVPT